MWFPGSQADIDKIENLQLQMARFILKAPRYTPRAALYGDLGWVPIATLQKGHRTKFFARVLTRPSMGFQVVTWNPIDGRNFS